MNLAEVTCPRCADNIGVFEMGALTLYLDFINLFIMLLRLFGQRR